jgi:hypothetical protein
LGQAAPSARPLAPELARLLHRGAQDRIPPDITTRIPSVTDEDDVAAVAAVLLDSSDDDTVRNEAANLLRRSGYAKLTDALVTILGRADEGPRFRAFCVQHLWMNVESAEDKDRSGIIVVLRRSLNDRDLPVRREALLALCRMGDPAGRDAAVAWLAAERADGLRDAAIRCVRELGLREHTPRIREFLRDTNENEIVRIAAIVTLSGWGDEESRSLIEEAARSGAFRLKRAAEMALKRLDAGGAAENPR